MYYLELETWYGGYYILSFGLIYWNYSDYFHEEIFWELFFIFISGYSTRIGINNSFEDHNVIRSATCYCYSYLVNKTL